MNPKITGLYEACIGVTEPISMIQYWEQFGYRIGQIGAISEASANQLYGVNSALKSIRLFHQNADHGLIRLMVWENTLNEGLQMNPMKAKGTRWITTLTSDILNLLNCAEQATAEGLPIQYIDPQWGVIYQTQKGQPFVSPCVGVREMLLLQPLTRQVLFQRFNYTVPNYGQIHLISPFKTSQITHMGMVIQDDSQETLNFYEKILGLLKTQDEIESTYETAQAGKKIFDLQPGERFFVTSFDDPRSSKLDWKQARSGRLYILRFPESIKLENHFSLSRPGCLGLSLYTYRIDQLDNYYQRIQDSTAQNITPIVINEFGEKSFSFVAPDGYFWTLIASN